MAVVLVSKKEGEETERREERGEFLPGRKENIKEGQSSRGRIRNKGEDELVRTTRGHGRKERTTREGWRGIGEWLKEMGWRAEKVVDLGGACQPIARLTDGAVHYQLRDLSNEICTGESPSSTMVDGHRA